MMKSVSGRSFNAIFFSPPHISLSRSPRTFVPSHHHHRRPFNSQIYCYSSKSGCTDSANASYRAHRAALLHPVVISESHPILDGQIPAYPLRRVSALKQHVQSLGMHPVCSHAEYMDVSVVSKDTLFAESKLDELETILKEANANVLVVDCPLTTEQQTNLGILFPQCEIVDSVALQHRFNLSVHNGSPSFESEVKKQIQLLNMYRALNVPFVAITGEPNVGKSALALRLSSHITQADRKVNTVKENIFDELPDPSLPELHSPPLPSSSSSSSSSAAIPEGTVFASPLLPSIEIFELPITKLPICILDMPSYVLHQFPQDSTFPPPHVRKALLDSDVIIHIRDISSVLSSHTSAAGLNRDHHHPVTDKEHSTREEEENDEDDEDDVDDFEEQSAQPGDENRWLDISEGYESIKKRMLDLGISQHVIRTGLVELHNKIDLSTDAQVGSTIFWSENKNVIATSSLFGSGMRQLVSRLEDIIRASTVLAEYTFSLPADAHQKQLVKWLQKNAKLESIDPPLLHGEAEEDEGVVRTVTIMMNSRTASAFNQYLDQVGSSLL